MLWWANLINLNEFVLRKLHTFVVGRAEAWECLFKQNSSLNWKPTHDFGQFNLQRNQLHVLHLLHSRVPHWQVWTLVEWKMAPWCSGHFTAKMSLFQFQFCVDFFCSPCVYMGSLLSDQDMYLGLRLPDHSKLPIGVNVSVHGCLSVSPLRSVFCPGCQCQLGWVTTFRD